MVRIAYVSVASFCKSGYGRCTAELVYRLLKWFEVDIFAYHGLQSNGRRVKVFSHPGNISHPILRTVPYALISL